jgi:hypothetical protein
VGIRFDWPSFLGPTCHDACADPVQDIEPAIFISQYSQPEANHGRKNGESLLSRTNWVDPIIYPWYTHHIPIIYIYTHTHFPPLYPGAREPTAPRPRWSALRSGSVDNCTCRVTRRRRRWGDWRRLAGIRRYMWENGGTRGIFRNSA